MTLNASGREAAEEYQLNESDLPAITNHAFTLSYSKSPLFSNDSASWNDRSLPKIAPLLVPTPHTLVRKQPLLVQAKGRPTRDRIDLMGCDPTTESIVVGPEPPSRQSMLRR